MVNGVCTLPTGGGGSGLPHALDFSGFCVGLDLNDKTWQDAERTIPTAAATDPVKALDAKAVDDAVNCPVSVYQ